MNKCTEVMEHIVDCDADVAFISETWMPNDKNDTTATIKSYGYKLLHNRRKDREKIVGGGVGVMLKSNILAKHISGKQFTSFEHTIVKIKMENNSNLTLITIYRLLFIPTNVFLKEFIILLEMFSASSEMFVLAGDVNIHLDNNNDIYTKQLNDIFQMFNLKQHVNFPTHNLGHTIDIVVARMDSPIIENIMSNNVDLSDHFIVQFEAKSTPPAKKQYRTVKYRNLKSVNNEAFCADIKVAYEEIPSNDLQEKVISFNNQAIKVINSHAPIKAKQIKIVPDAPWFDLEYNSLRQQRRKAEKRYKKSRLAEHKVEFVNLRKQTTALAFNKKRSYFAKKIEDCNGNSKALFNSLDKLLDERQETVLPSHESSSELAERFQSYFRDKISNIRKSFVKPDEKVYNAALFPPGNPPLVTFEPSTEDELRSIILTYGINCSPEDPIPSTLLRKNINLFIPIWLDIVNLSLSQGSMECLKNAILNPLIKELDELIDTDELKNYRPVSNLTFLSKLIERVVAIRLENHMNVNELHSSKQYGYKKGHSTEMLLLKIVNDLFIACDNKTPTLLMLLDLSAAFDTVDQLKLLEILRNKIGIHGTAHKWFESFLTSRTQKVKIKDAYSTEDKLQYGVPQGSVLGPVLFNIYIRSFYQQVNSAGFDVEGFADDHQLRRPFSPLFQVTTLRDRIQNCFVIIGKWMNEFFLRLNAKKTKILVICPASLKRDITINGTFINGQCIRFVSNAKNLGVIVDDELSFDAHIQKTVSTCFLTIRKISRIKSFLKPEHLKTLVTALILSKLDYCNALYLGLHSHLLIKLQSVQNSAIRLVCKINRYERISITNLLKHFHWLRVKDRVTFKVLLIVHKALNNTAPPDIKSMLQPSNSERTRKLEISQSNGRYGDKAFAVAAPKLWNALPLNIRVEEDTSQFKKNLKTFLFSASETFYQRVSIK